MKGMRSCFSLGGTNGTAAGFLSVVIRLFQCWSGQRPVKIQPRPDSGLPRPFPRPVLQYYRKELNRRFCFWLAPKNKTLHLSCSRCSFASSSLFYLHKVVVVGFDFRMLKAASLCTMRPTAIVYTRVGSCARESMPLCFDISLAALA